MRGRKERGVSNSRPGGEWARHASTKWDWTLWPCRTTFGSCSTRPSPLRSVRPIPSHLSSIAADLDSVEVPLPATPDLWSPAPSWEIFDDLHLFPPQDGGGFLCSRIIVTVTEGDRKDSPIIRAPLGECSFGTPRWTRAIFKRFGQIRPKSITNRKF